MPMNIPAYTMSQAAPEIELQGKVNPVPTTPTNMSIASGTPMAGDSRLPMSTQQPKIDWAGDVQKGQAIADNEGVLHDKEVSRGQKAYETSLKNHDREILTAYTAKDDTDLVTPQGLQKALKDLKGQVSSETYMGIGAQRQKLQESEAKISQELAKAKDEDLKAIVARHNEYTQLMAPALEAYDTAVKNKSSPEDSVKTFREALSQSKSQASEYKYEDGSSVFTPSQLKSFDTMTPEIARGAIKSAPWFSSMILKEAQARFAGAGVGLREAQAQKARSGPAGQLDDEQIDAIATEVRANQYQGVSRLAAIDKGRVFARARAQAKELGQTGEEMVFRQLETKANSSALSALTKQETMVGAFEITARKQLDLLENISKEIPRTEWPAINNAILNAEIYTGLNPAALKFTGTLVATQGELAKILEGNTGAAGASVDSRKLAGQILMKGVGDGNLHELRMNIDKELQNRMDGFSIQKEILKNKMTPGHTTPISGKPKIEGGTDQNELRPQIIGQEQKKEREHYDAATDPAEKERARQNIISLNREAKRDKLPEVEVPSEVPKASEKPAGAPRWSQSMDGTVMITGDPIESLKDAVSKGKLKVGGRFMMPGENVPRRLTKLPTE